MKRAAAAVALAVLLLAGSCGGDGGREIAPGGPSTAWEAERFDEYYAANCGGCHGARRDGDHAPPLTPRRLAGAFAGYVEAANHPRHVQIWERTGLTDADVRGLLEYLRSAPP